MSLRDDLDKLAGSVYRDVTAEVTDQLGSRLLPREARPSSMSERCSCTVHFEPDVGSFDTVTGEWLPDKQTTRVWLELSENCSMHPTIRCWSCGALSVHRAPRTGRPISLQQGWALRADGLVAACPQHLEFMPPHPQAFKQ